LSEITRDFIKKAKIITPERAPSSPLGYRYPVAEEYFGEDARQQLDNLVKEGLMERDFHQRELGCPKCGSINIIVRFFCPKCASTNLVKREVLEHWPCGYVGPEDEFKSGKCPKCRKKLERIGVNFKRLGPMWKCLNCSEVFQTPSDKLDCANCDSSFAKEEASEVTLYAYRITARLEEELEAALYQKSYLSKRLEEMGFGIEPEENLYGRSGLKLGFYVVAYQGKGSLKTRIAIDLLSAAEEVTTDEVFALYAKALDLGAFGLVLVAIPRFSEESRRLMEFYGVAYVEVQTLQGSAEAIIEKLREIIETPPRPPRTAWLGWSFG